MWGEIKEIYGFIRIECSNENWYEKYEYFVNAVRLKPIFFVIFVSSDKEPVNKLMHYKKSDNTRLLFIFSSFCVEIKLTNTNF